MLNIYNDFLSKDMRIYLKTELVTTLLVTNLLVTNLLVTNLFHTFVSENQKVNGMKTENPFVLREVEQLSELQLNFLHALANGITTGFSRKDVIKKYRLESSANVQSIKKSLLKKDLIDIDGQNISFNDSLFKLWLKRQKFYE